MKNVSFLVCVYNVAPDQPYTIFKAPTSSTAQDIITQAMMKAHRADTEDLRRFVLMEELEVSGAETHGAKRLGGENVEKRILLDDENVYLAQSEWKTNGRFIIVNRNEEENLTDRKKVVLGHKSGIKSSKKLTMRKQEKSPSLGTMQTATDSTESTSQDKPRHPRSRSSSRTRDQSAESKLRKISSKLSKQISK